MAKDVYIAAVGLTKVDLTGRIFTTVFELSTQAWFRERKILGRAVSEILEMSDNRRRRGTASYRRKRWPARR
jgi:hypothetical protein